MKLFKLVLVALMACPVQSGAADQVITPFTLDLSAASTQALLSGITGFQSPSGQFVTQLPDQFLTSPYAVALTGIHLTLNYAFSTPLPGADLDQWRIQSTNISAEMVVDSINATQTVVEQFGGTTLTLTIDATCSDVHLILPSGSTQVSASVDLSVSNGKTAFTLADFSADWVPSSWQVTSMNCQAPNGFGSLVAQTAEAQLQTINPFFPEIQNQIQAQLNSASSSAVSWTLAAAGSSGVSMTLSPESLQLQSNGGALLEGVAEFTFAQLENTQCQNQVQAELPQASASSSDSLVIPIAAMQALIRCGYLNGSLSDAWTSQDFPAFQSLLGNWFLKLFVWPDLEGFGTSSVFNFELFPQAQPNIRAMTQDASGDFQFNLSVPLLMAVDAPTKEGSEHYVDFATSLSGPATLSVKNGVLSFEQKLSRLSISPSWDALYVQAHHPDEDIWTSIVAGYLKGYLASPGLSYVLPSWNVPGAFSLAVENANYDGANVTLSLNIKTLSSSTK